MVGGDRWGCKELGVLGGPGAGITKEDGWSEELMKEGLRKLKKVGSKPPAQGRERNYLEKRPSLPADGTSRRAKGIFLN